MIPPRKRAVDRYPVIRVLHNLKDPILAEELILAASPDVWIFVGRMIRILRGLKMDRRKGFSLKKRSVLTFVEAGVNFIVGIHADESFECLLYRTFIYIRH